LEPGGDRRAFCFLDALFGEVDVVRRRKRVKQEIESPVPIPSEAALGKERRGDLSQS
jgi:hypothetical protein